MLKVIEVRGSFSTWFSVGTNYDDEGDSGFIDGALIVGGWIEKLRLYPASELEAGH
jgi:hypothetical protein